MNPLLLVCSHYGVGMVVPIIWAARARIIIRIKLPNRSSGSKIVMTATRNLKARHEILERISDCGSYAAPALLAGSTAGTQASKVLCIERAQGCRDRRPDADDPFFYAWPQHRDPKFTAKN